jgi:hypothetical protein
VVGDISERTRKGIGITMQAKGRTRAWADSGVGPGSYNLVMPLLKQVRVASRPRPRELTPLRLGQSLLASLPRFRVCKKYA